MKRVKNNDFPELKAEVLESESLVTARFGGITPDISISVAEFIEGMNAVAQKFSEGTLCLTDVERGSEKLRLSFSPSPFLGIIRQLGERLGDDIRFRVITSQIDRTLVLRISGQKPCEEPLPRRITSYARMAGLKLTVEEGCVCLTADLRVSDYITLYSPISGKNPFSDFLKHNL